MNGELIGMNSATASLGSLGDAANTQSGSIGIGFAIPVDHAARIASELIAHRYGIACLAGSAGRHREGLRGRQDRWRDKR